MEAHIIKIARDDFNEWLELALKLWPDSSVKEIQSALTQILQSPREAGFLIRDRSGTTLGFMNLSLRYEYVAGATQSPVAYLEGIYVKDKYRKQGIGTFLIEYAEQWAIEQGCVELASDALLENTASY
ncbi:MAG: GNAT family N-acetyltransferase, partial [Cyanobacteriota bacterium]|nr:GNAT family N-acetyltransferase [Cyanobacteriota bacterium]